MSVDEVMAEALRIYPFDEPRFDGDDLDDFSPEEAEVWAILPGELLRKNNETAAADFT